MRPFVLTPHWIFLNLKKMRENNSLTFNVLSTNYLTLTGFSKSDVFRNRITYITQILIFIRVFRSNMEVYRLVLASRDIENDSLLQITLILFILTNI